MRIDHPAVQGESVSLWRWLLFHVGAWTYERGVRLKAAGDRLINATLHPDRDPFDEEIPF